MPLGKLHPAILYYTSITELQEIVLRDAVTFRMKSYPHQEWSVFSFLEQLVTIHLDQIHHLNYLQIHQPVHFLQILNLKIFDLLAPYIV